MTRIVVKKRSFDHFAWLEDRPEHEGRGGVTVEAAIKNLIIAYSDRFPGQFEVSYQLSGSFVKAMLCQSSRA